MRDVKRCWNSALFIQLTIKFSSSTWLRCHKKATCLRNCHHITWMRRLKRAATINSFVIVAYGIKTTMTKFGWCCSVRHWSKWSSRVKHSRNKGTYRTGSLACRVICAHQRLTLSCTRQSGASLWTLTNDASGTTVWKPSLLRTRWTNTAPRASEWPGYREAPQTMNRTLTIPPYG